MTNTTNYGLRKPEANDYVNVEDLNYNADTIDAAMQENKTKRADLKLSNLDTPQEALANLGAGVRPNLLDNWDFRAGHVVNQRGQTSISKPDILNDRWRIFRYASGTATLTDNGINLTGDFDFGQTIESSRLPNTPNIPVTISALFSDGTFVSKTSVLNNNGEWETIAAPVNSNVHLTFIRNWNDGGKNIDLLFFWISNGSITPVAAKLETGSTQTLAYHKSDGKWELLPQPESDYATQLRRCKRYYESSTSSWTIPANLTMMVPFEVEKRIVPTVTIENVSGGSAIFDYVGPGCFRVINPSQQSHDFRWQASAEL